jgi:hypothetical protein
MRPYAPWLHPYVDTEFRLPPPMLLSEVSIIIENAHDTLIAVRRKLRRLRRQNRMLQAYLETAAMRLHELYVPSYDALYNAVTCARILETNV